MLLSRSCGSKLQGSLQLDMSYATISVFGQPKRLYRETLMKYVVSSQEKPHNFPIYSMHSDKDSFILYNAEIYPPTNVKALALEQEKIINEKYGVQTQEISEIIDITDTQGKLDETKKPVFPSKQIAKTPYTNYEHEVL